MQVEYSQHAKQRMASRGIPRAAVQQVLDHPESVTPSYRDRLLYIAPVGVRYVAVVCTTESPPTVVTVYLVGREGAYNGLHHERAL